MPGFEINTSCIKSIKASYETKLESNKRMRGMDEYQAAERETGGEAGMEPRTVASKGQPAKKSRQSVAKHSAALFSRVSLSRRRLGGNRSLKLRYLR